VDLKLPKTFLFLFWMNHNHLKQFKILFNNCFFYYYIDRLLLWNTVDAA
jgi:hypothetical protein